MASQKVLDKQKEMIYKQKDIQTIPKKDKKLLSTYQLYSIAVIVKTSLFGNYWNRGAPATTVGLCSHKITRNQKYFK